MRRGKLLDQNILVDEFVEMNILLVALKCEEIGIMVVLGFLCNFDIKVLPINLG